MRLLPLLLVGCFSPFEGDAVGECVDRADNDGDALVDCDDPDCAGSRACRFREVCLNGLDDDGDGRIDCDDGDCSDLPECGPEDCTNGVDDNGNGLVDCADPICGCVGYAEWTFEGGGLVAEDAYSGTLAMRLTVSESTGAWAVGDRLCEARYLVESTEVGATCTSCEFAFVTGDLPMDTSFGGGGTSGSYCDDWHNFAPGFGYNPITWFPGFGWDPSSPGSEIRVYYSQYGYTAWYPIANTTGSLDGDGQFAWEWTVGEYAY